MGMSLDSVVNRLESMIKGGGWSKTLAEVGILLAFIICLPFMGTIITVSLWAALVWTLFVLIIDRSAVTPIQKLLKRREAKRIILTEEEVEDMKTMM